MAQAYDRMHRKFDERRERKASELPREYRGWTSPVVKWDRKRSKAEVKADKKARRVEREIRAVAEQERQQQYKGDPTFGVF